MEKIIYLPFKVKDKFESMDNWYDKSKFKEKPEDGFNCKATLNSDTLELGVDYILEKGFYYPDRDQSVESTMESIEEVKGYSRISGNIKSKPKKKKTLVNKLKVKDFSNPMFDKQSPTRREIKARKEIYDLIDDINILEEEAMIMDSHEGDFMSDSYNESMMSVGSEGKKESVIEGLTVTDNFNTVGYTYFKIDGMLHASYVDKNNGGVKFFKEVINSSEDFEKMLKKADRVIKKAKK